MYEKFSNGSIHDIVNLNEKVFSANKKSLLCFANILAIEIAYFSNVLTLLAFSRKYQNICVQVLYMKLREIRKTCELLRTLLYNNKLSMVRLGKKNEPILLLLIQ